MEAGLSEDVRAFRGDLGCPNSGPALVRPQSKSELGGRTELLCLSGQPRCCHRAHSTSTLGTAAWPGVCAWDSVLTWEKRQAELREEPGSHPAWRQGPHLGPPPRPQQPPRTCQQRGSLGSWGWILTLAKSLIVSLPPAPGPMPPLSPPFLLLSSTQTADADSCISGYHCVSVIMG